MMEILNYLPQLMSGLSVTVILMLGSISIGLILAVSMTMVGVSKCHFLKKIVALFIFFIRGTPLLVQLFLVYYGVGQFEIIRHSFLWIFLREPTVCAILTLSINSACYTTILLQGALQSIPKNEVFACQALGMSPFLAFRRVLFPRAFRIALPAYTNEVVMILKATSLASTITLLDLMGVTQQIIAETYQSVEWYVIVGTVYLLLNGLIAGSFFLLRYSSKFSRVINTL